MRIELLGADLVGPAAAVEAWRAVEEAVDEAMDGGRGRGACGVGLGGGKAVLRWTRVVGL